MMYKVKHDPVGYACNMGYIVLDPKGNIIKRGPKWACEVEANRWNTGNHPAYMITQDLNPKIKDS